MLFLSRKRYGKNAQATLHQNVLVPADVQLTEHKLNHVYDTPLPAIPDVDETQLSNPQINNVYDTIVFDSQDRDCPRLMSKTEIRDRDEHEYTDINAGPQHLYQELGDDRAQNVNYTALKT